MSRKLKTKYILILVVISFLLIRVLIVLPEDWVATNFFNGLFGVAYNHLPDKIYCNRNCYEIKNAVLNKKNNGEWDINTGNKWYPIKDITCNDGILEKKSENDSSTFYRFKPEFYQDKFAHEFEYISAYISWDKLKSFSYKVCNSGIYEHTGLYMPYSYCKERRVNLPIYLHASSIAYSLRTFIEKNFTKAYHSFKDEYRPGCRVYFDLPLLYIPFPMTGKAYLFSGEVLRDFDEVTEYVHDQNFYAVLAYIPLDVKRLGKIIACDHDGLLLSLGRKTPKMSINLKRMDNDKNHYAATVHYKKRIWNRQINEDDYKRILNYSQSSDSLYKMYDERIFVNLRRILSSLEYNVLKMNLNWPEMTTEKRVIEFQPM